MSECVTANWAAHTCGHPVCSETVVRWHGLHPDNQAELCPKCAGENLTRLYLDEANATLEAAGTRGDIESIRAALLDLAERLEKPVTGMSNGDMAKEIRRIAG